jgi:hypothetical protein
MLNWLIGLWRRIWKEKPAAQIYHRSNLHGRR